MRAICLLVCLCLSLGTSLARGSHQDDEGEGLSVAEVRELEARLPCLKEGMSSYEVRLWLGELLDKAPLVRGSGPIAGYRTVYGLRRGYALEIVSDRDRFVRAVMKGEEWERERKEREAGQPNNAAHPTPCHVAPRGR